MANLSNINNKFLVTTTGEVLIGQTANNGNRLQITGADGASYIYLKTDVATTGGRIGFNGDALRVFNQQAGGSLSFGTAGATKMTILSGGNVGIGTSGFAQKRLDISGPTGGQVLITGANDAVGTTAGIMFRSEASEENGLARVKGGIFFERIAGTYGNGKLKFAVNSSANNDTVTVSDVAITIDTNKNVGIGTASPTGFRLVVENTAEDLLKLHNSADGLDSLISFTNPGGTLARIQGVDNGGLQLDTGNNAGGINTNAMFIDNAGKVGIGSTDPEAKLTVSGGVGAGTHTHAVFTGTAGRGLALKSGQTGGQHNGKAIIDAQDTEASGASMDFQIGGSTKLAIDSSGNTTFAGNITVSGTSSSFNTGGSGTFVTNDAGGYPRITITSASAQLGLFRASDGGMYIGGSSAGFRVYNSSFAQKLLIDSGNGDATFAGNIYIASTGNGIFLGGTSSSSVLKKFVGNQAGNGAQWTPTVTTSQGTSPTITSSSGYYQQVGNVVTVSFEFTMGSGHASGAGTVIISNLPIAIADTNHVSGCGSINDLGKTINVRHYTATNQIGMNFYDGNYCGTQFRTVGTVTYWAAT